MATPDYLKLLEGYPGLAQQLRSIDAAGGLNQAQLSEQRQRALATFGQIPDNLDTPLTGGAADAGGTVNADIDQATRDLAGNLTRGGVSTVAQLQRQYDAQRNTGIARLAAHGLARSGGVGQTIREALGGRERALFGANQSLMDQLGQAYQGFLTQQGTLRGQQTDAVNAAQTGLGAQIAAGQIGGGTGSAGAGSTTGIGSSGNRYVPPGYTHATAAPNVGVASVVKPPKPKPVASPSGGLARALRFG